MYQYTSVHIFADRQSEQSQDRRHHVQQRGTVNSFVLLDVRALHANDPELPMLHRRTGGFHGDTPRPQMIGVKAMIRNQYHGNVRSSEFQQRLQHHVVETISAVYNIFVDLELFFRDALHPRRMEMHESVTKVIDAVVINRHEVPRLMPQDPGGGVMN